jgi:hypothetical protein
LSWKEYGPQGFQIVSVAMMTPAPKISGSPANERMVLISKSRLTELWGVGAADYYFVIAMASWSRASSACKALCVRRPHQEAPAAANRYRRKVTRIDLKRRYL